MDASLHKFQKYFFNKKKQIFYKKYIMRLNLYKHEIFLNHYSLFLFY